MHVRGGPPTGRSSILASLGVALLLALGTAGSAVAADGDTTTPAPPPAPGLREPRAQEPGDPTGFRLPFEPGLAVPIEQGWLTSFSHNGRAAYAYDFGLYEGTPVLAAASGVVTWVHAGETKCGGAELRPDANYVTIEHADGSATHYGHLGSVEVAVGDVVEVGQQIGRSGKTGYSGCLPHLHFARQFPGAPVTQSVPVYFAGYGDRAFVSGDVVTAPEPCPSLGEEAPNAKPPVGSFCATYGALGAAGPAYFSRLEDVIDFDWGEEAPGGYWLDDASAGFSGGWSGRFRFTVPDEYAFQLLATGSVRVRIDGRTVLRTATDDERGDESIFTIFLRPGLHRIEVLHDDADGQGRLSLGWSRVLSGAAARWASESLVESPAG